MDDSRSGTSKYKMSLEHFFGSESKEVLTDGDKSKGQRSQLEGTPSDHI